MIIFSGYLSGIAELHLTESNEAVIRSPVMIPPMLHTYLSVIDALQS